MARKARKKAPPKVKFQVSRSGIAGIGVVCFCIFLWMFLLGVWAGQSLLFKAVDTKDLSAASTNTKKNHQFDPVLLTADKHKKKK